MRKLSAAHVAALKTHEQKVGKLYDELLFKMRSSTPRNITRRVEPLIEILFKELHAWVQLYAIPPGKKKRTISPTQEQYLRDSVFVGLGAFLAMGSSSAEFLKDVRPSFDHIKKYS